MILNQAIADISIAFFVHVWTAIGTNQENQLSSKYIFIQGVCFLIRYRVWKRFFREEFWVLSVSRRYLSHHMRH